jgi:hypothetical protein
VPFTKKKKKKQKKQMMMMMIIMMKKNKEENSSHCNVYTSLLGSSTLVVLTYLLTYSIEQSPS